MIILQTERLLLRTMNLDDADFILELLNSPGWLEFIGDRGMRTEADARAYLEEKVLSDYERQGFGFYIIERLEDGKRLGNCGLVRRQGLDHVDLGYSLLPDYFGKGYAHEAAYALLIHGLKELGLSPIQAITTKDNDRSIHLLKKLGMHFEKKVQLPDDDEELLLYSISSLTEVNHP